MTNNPINFNDPARDVRCESRLAVAPWWLRTLAIAWVAATLAYLYGGRLTVWTLGVTLGSAVGMIVAAKYWERRHGVRPHRRASRIGVVVLFSTIAVLFVALTVLRGALPPDTAQSYGALFAAAASVLAAGAALSTHLRHPASDQ